MYESFFYFKDLTYFHNSKNLYPLHRVTLIPTFFSLLKLIPIEYLTPHSSQWTSSIRKAFVCFSHSSLLKRTKKLFILLTVTMKIVLITPRAIFPVSWTWKVFCLVSTMWMITGEIRGHVIVSQKEWVTRWKIYDTYEG